MQCVGTIALLFAILLIASIDDLWRMKISRNEKLAIKYQNNVITNNRKRHENITKKYHKKYIQRREIRKWEFIRVPYWHQGTAIQCIWQNYNLRMGRRGNQKIESVDFDFISFPTHNAQYVPLLFSPTIVNTIVLLFLCFYSTYTCALCTSHMVRI